MTIQIKVTHWLHDTLLQMLPGLTLFSLISIMFLTFHRGAAASPYETYSKAIVTGHLYQILTHRLNDTGQLKAACAETEVKFKG